MANRFWISDGGNYGDTANWSTTSGGSGGASVPSTADVAIFDANSGNCVVEAGRTTQDINVANYPNGKQISLGVNNLICNRHFTGNASATPPITGTTGTFIIGSSSTAATWSMSSTIFDCNVNFAGTGTKTMTGSFKVKKLPSWTTTCNLASDGGKITSEGGWTGTSFFNDAANNPTVDILGGTITGTLPNTPNGCLLKPSVSDIVFAETYPYKTQIRETTYLIAEESTYDFVHSNAQTYFITFDGKLKCSAIQFESIYYVSGNFTQEEDLNVSVWDCNNISNAVITSNGFKINLSTWNLRATNTISGANVKFVGTGDFNKNSTTGSGTLDGVTTLNCNIEVDTSGTLTRFNRDVIFTGGSWKHTNGTYVQGTGLSKVNGAFSLDINDAFDWTSFDVNSALTLTTHCRITTLDVYDGGSVVAPYAFSANQLKLKDSCQISRPNDDYVIEVDTYFYMFGTNEKTPSIIANPININEFVSSTSTTMNPAHNTESNTKRKTFTLFSDMTTFTWAFDYIHRGYVGYSFISGTDGYMWVPSNYTTSLFFFMTPSDAYYANVGSISSTKRRVVITKSLGSAMKFYVDGVLKSTSVSGSSANLINANISINSFSKELTGDVLLFANTEKDATWVAADYAKFVANNNSSSNQYDATEPNLTAGWHIDLITNEDTTTKVKFNGVDSNLKLSLAQFLYVDACESSTRLYDWYGDVYECCGVYEVTGANLGGGVTVYS